MSLYNLDHSPEFPKRKYAPGGGSVMVQTRHEEVSLGLGWSDNDPTPGVDVDASAEAVATTAKKGKK